MSDTFRPLRLTAAAAALEGETCAGNSSPSRRGEGRAEEGGTP